MVKNSKAKSRLDKFYHLAKEQGFRSRAAFKLIQLNKKYNFFAECRTVLDLCAAPGGWMQVAAKHVPVSSLIIGVDLVPIRPIRGTKSIVGDITSEKCVKLIEKESCSRLFDLVLHDGSPNVGGAWHSESLSQSILVLDAIKLAAKFLAPDGWFISKVFRSKDYNALLYVSQQLFKRVEATKPTASRNTSAEIFLVCQGYKAPEKIDPKLLDSRYVLQDYLSSGKLHGPLVMQKKQPKKGHRRFREGYEEGASTTFKSASILEFIKAKDPVEILGLYTQLHFDLSEGVDPAHLQVVNEHPRTTPVILEACKDLLVLGKKEFKMLLKWQGVMVKELGREERVEEAAGKLEVDPEERMLREMKEIQERLEHKAKKKEKKLREMKKYAKLRLAQFQQSEGITDQMMDNELFTMEDLPANLIDQAAPCEVENSSSSDEEEMDYELMEEDYLEQSYQRYLKRRGDEMEAEPQLKRRLRLEEKENSDLEENFAEEKSGTDTEDEFRLLDVDGKAEILAMARKLLHRKEKESLVDAAYSRYVFQDKNLPRWFVHDNDVYNRPQRMVSRAEIEQEKELLRAMDARPIKKVAEAKTRKAKRLANRVKAAMKRAEGIASQEELSHQTKMKQITKVMNLAKQKENGRFVGKEKLKKMGRMKRMKVQKRMPRVDRRLKSDKRQKGLGREGKNSRNIKQKRALAKQNYRQKKRAK